MIRSRPAGSLLALSPQTIQNVLAKHVGNKPLTNLFDRAIVHQPLVQLLRSKISGRTLSSTFPRHSSMICFYIDITAINKVYCVISVEAWCFKLKRSINSIHLNIFLIPLIVFLQPNSQILILCTAHTLNVNR